MTAWPRSTEKTQFGGRHDSVKDTILEIQSWESDNAEGREVIPAGERWVTSKEQQVGLRDDQKLGEGTKRAAGHSSKESCVCEGTSVWDTACLGTSDRQVGQFNLQGFLNSWLCQQSRPRQHCSRMVPGQDCVLKWSPTPLLFVPYDNRNGTEKSSQMFPINSAPLLPLHCSTCSQPCPFPRTATYFLLCLLLTQAIKTEGSCVRSTMRTSNSAWHIAGAQYPLNESLP